jgi:hypothetical protein
VKQEIQRWKMAVENKKSRGEEMVVRTPSMEKGEKKIIADDDSELFYIKYYIRIQLIRSGLMVDQFIHVFLLMLTKI